MHNDLPFRLAAVRDLAWAIGSPPILCRMDAAVTWPVPEWYYNVAEAFAPVLRRLDTDPSPLLVELEDRKDRRLGLYHERLWQYWLKHNDRYRLLYANLPVREHQRTIGEFDLLVEDTISGKTLHWEVAVKFYLNVGDSSAARHWWGPGQRDRLDIKTQHMLEHQSRLRQEPAASTLLTRLGIHVDESWLLLKGRLFYPAWRAAAPPEHACPGHLQGFWTTAARFADTFDNQQLSLLQRHQWLAPLDRVGMDTTTSRNTVLDTVAGGFGKSPQCIAIIEDGTEITRGFVVADDWE